MPMETAVANVHKLADLCRSTEWELRSAVDAFAKLKKAIESEGYTVIWNTAHDTYSVVKLNRVPEKG